MKCVEIAFSGLEIFAKWLEVVFLVAIFPIMLFLALPFYAIGLFERIR